MSLALERHLDALLHTFASLGDAEGMSLATARLAELRLQQSRALEALQLYRRSWELWCESAGGPAERGASLLAMARCAAALNEPGAAAELAAAALEEYTQARLPLGCGLALMVHAVAQFGDDSHGPSVALRKAVSTFVDGGHPGAAARALAMLAEWHLGRGEGSLASLCADHGGRMAALHPDGAEVVVALVAARIAVAAGKHLEAEPFAERAVAGLDGAAQPGLLALAHQALAAARAHRGALDAALQSWESACGLARSAGDLGLARECRVAGANAARAAEHPMAARWEALARGDDSPS
jgi:tetratricopeptide (TPR) repeat protein